jgi:membrane-bound ClpP family serine protease
MILIGIISLIVLGIILLFLEFFVVPGVSVFGIAGFVVLALGIYFSYSSYGIYAGHGVLFGTITVLGTSFYVAYRKGVWKRMALNAEVKSKVNIESLNVKVGDKGKTVSRLAPMGTIIINNAFYEAGSKGIFINEETDIEISNIENNKIIVKPIK